MNEKSEDSADQLIKYLEPLLEKFTYYDAYRVGFIFGERGRGPQNNNEAILLDYAKKADQEAVEKGWQEGKEIRNTE